MRQVLLLLVALACAIPMTEAAAREGRQAQAAAQQASRQAEQVRQQVSKRRTPQRQARRAQTTRRTAALRPGDVRTQRSGVVVRGAAAARVTRSATASRCTTRNGRRVCTPARNGVAGWQRGLPVASFAQRECPNGTFATLARGHDDVVRCMPL